MSLLLDTHAAIWYLLRSDRLSPIALQSVRRAIASGTQVYVSVISIVETIYLVERNRIPVSALDSLRQALANVQSGLVIAPVDVGVAQAVLKVSRTLVPDMPDRIIAATALNLNVPLITRDRRLQSAGMNVIW